MKDLRLYTQARVSLGSSGGSLPTAPLLALRLAHARARDAVRVPFDVDALMAQMAERGWQAKVLDSAAGSREQYLRRPDLGRTLAKASAEALEAVERPQRLVFAVSDGLSAPAAERHAVPLLERIFALLDVSSGQASPIFVIRQGRVALSDPLGERLDAELLVLLIGERPGLSSPDSLGAYLTWRPRAGRTDAERNCVSNVHSEGLSYERAAQKIVFLVKEMQRLQLSGIALKDTSSLSPVSLDGSI